LDNYTKYLLQIADSSVIIGQRLAELCGHGPVLEEDIALTNMSLDYIGQARLIYARLAEHVNDGRSEDDWAFLRNETQYRNLLICEQENGDFAETIARQFYFSAFAVPFFKSLSNSKDEFLSGLAQKSVKEATYHLRHCSEWIIRLGDGTPESHSRMQQAIDKLWMYTGEMFAMTPEEDSLLNEGISVQLADLKPLWHAKIADTLEAATLVLPKDSWMQSGGKMGKHSELLGFMLAELQYMQRAFPGAKW
jgi:ring-1,2-phenylacetyl-CoA epoxidase subunit PaaC